MTIGTDLLSMNVYYLNKLWNLELIKSLAIYLIVLKLSPQPQDDTTLGLLNLKL